MHTILYSTVQYSTCFFVRPPHYQHVSINSKSYREPLLQNPILDSMLLEQEKSTYSTVQKKFCNTTVLYLMAETTTSNLFVQYSTGP